MRYAFYVIFILSIFIIPVFYIFKGPITQTATGNITITSSAFKNNQKIPLKYTCQGQNINPPLSFTNLPPDTKSLVLIVTNPDIEGGRVQWLLWDIDSSKSQIEADSMAINFHVGLNSWEKLEYTGPCPPPVNHRYFFKVFALDNFIGLLKDPNVNLINQQMTGHILDQGQLIGIY